MRSLRFLLVGLGVGTTACLGEFLPEEEHAVTQVSVGDSRVCAVRGATGELYCWGSPTFVGASNVDLDADRVEPVRISAERDWQKVTVGSDHSCALVDNGSIYCWGKGNEGQLADGSSEDSQTPVPVENELVWNMVRADGTRTCAIDQESQELWCAGTAFTACESSGGDTLTVFDPDRSYEEVDLGVDHGCARADSELVCFGANESGQHGRGDTEPAPCMTILSGDYESIAAGGTTTCALRDDGVLVCWGTLHGTSVLTPTEIDGPDFREVSVGDQHICGIAQDDGSLYCWGRGTEGQLGTGDTEDRAEPTKVEFGNVRWARVSAGKNVTCAIVQAGDVPEDGGALYCWGFNDHGQVGQESTSSILLPTRVYFP